MKKEFGKDLVSWGGELIHNRCCHIEQQKEVGRGSKKRIEDLEPEGGYIFAAVHNIQPDVPSGKHISNTRKPFDKYDRY